MAASNAEQNVTDIIARYDKIDRKEFMKLNMEQAVRLIAMFKLNLSREEIKAGAKELKARHQEVQFLHKLQALVNKLTQESGDDRGTIKLQHAGLLHENLEFAGNLTKLLKSHTRYTHDQEGNRMPMIDAKGEAAEKLKASLEMARALGMGDDFEIKSHYEGEEVTHLLSAVGRMVDIDDSNEWTKLQEIKELRDMLDEAVSRHGLEIEWPVDSFSIEGRSKLMHRVETLLKDLGLQNDMQLQDLNRKNQEWLELVQMARSIVKSIHDDKVHKMRAAAGR